MLVVVQEVVVEFAEVVRGRRMTRDFQDKPLPDGVLTDLLDLARRAPSAGNSQGTVFLVLDTPELVAEYWSVTLPPERRATFPWPGLLVAPVLIVPIGEPSVYVDRYAEPDKARTGLGESADAWSVPYWYVDTAMAAMTLLLAAEDRGFGALFFGLFDHEQAVMAQFGVPADRRPIGTIALGIPTENDRPSQSSRRPRQPLDKVVHVGRWNAGGGQGDPESGNP